MFNWFKKNRLSLLGIAASLVTLIFVGALVASYYNSQLSLQKANLELIKHNMEIRSNHVTHYLKNLQNNLSCLANGPQISGYFTYKSLGMPLQYGMKAKSIEVERALQKTLAGTGPGNMPHFTALSLVDNSGEVIAQQGEIPTCPGPKPAAAKAQSSAPQTSLLVFECQGRSVVGMEAGCMLRRQKVGRLLAYLNPQAIQDLIVSSHATTMKPVDIFLCARYGRAWHPVGKGPTSPLNQEQQNLLLSSRDFAHLEVPAPKPGKGSLLVSFYPLSGTPLALINISKADAVLGFLRPGSILLVLILTTCILLVGLAAVIKLTRGNIALASRLEVEAEQKESARQQALVLQIEMDSRRQAKRALEESERRHRQFVTNANDMIFRTDINGNFVFLNPVAAQITGYGLDELLAMNSTQLVPPEDREEIIDFYRRQIVEKIANTYREFPIRNKQGKTVWVGQNVQLVQENDQVTGLEAVSRDITELVNTRQALEDAQRNLEDKVLSRSQALRKTNRDLRERIKEQQCLYAVTRITASPEKSLSDLIQRAVQILPGGMQYPKIAAASITAFEHQATTSDWRETPWMISAEIQGRKEAVGSVRIAYLKEPPSQPDEPFLEEEHNLIEAVAAEMANLIDHQQTMADLLEAKRIWEGTFEVVPELVTILDANHRIVRANQAVSQKMGIDHSEVVGKYCWEVMRDLESPDQDCNLCVENTTRTDQADQLAVYKGNEHLVSKSPLFDKNGDYAGCVHVARDVSQLMNAERAAKEQLDFLQKVMDTFPNPVFFRNVDGVFTGCNQAYENFVGKPRKDILDKSIFEVLPKENAKRHREKDKELLANPGLQIFESSVWHADGSVREVIIYKATYSDSADQVQGIVGVLVDISHRKKMEAELQESEVRYRTLVETMPEGLVQVDAQRCITFINQKFAEMLGYAENDLLGRDLFELVSPDNKKQVKQQWENRRQGQVSTYEITWLRSDGSTVPARVSPRALEDEEGNFAGSYSVITDMREYKRLEAQLLQSQKLEAIGQLAAGIAHEINTPTQYVSDNIRFINESFADILRIVVQHLALANQIKAKGEMASELAALDEVNEEVDLDYLIEEIPLSLEQTMEGIERVATIVRSMKEFAHPGSGEMIPFDLTQGITSTIDVTRNEWKYVADMETDLDPGMPNVSCVPSELNQVILNIIINAAQAIAEKLGDNPVEKGLITINTKQEDNQAVIRIKDTGPGIDPQMVQRVFDPFFTTKDPGQGTGQGLAIAYSIIVDKHNGAISVESESGEGTTFIIRLPLEEGSQNIT